MQIKNEAGESIIKLPGTKRFIALEPTLEELINKPTKFTISLFDENTEEAIGTYKFNEPIKAPNWTRYKSSKITSKKQKSKVPQDLIKASNYILLEIAKSKKEENKNYELKHNCNFYLMRHNINYEKFKKITNIFKKQKYKFQNDLIATKTY
jgi:hypothetical protein